MLRIPYEKRKKEGVPGCIPHLGGLQYKVDCFAENCFIHFIGLPDDGLNRMERCETVTVSLTSFPVRIEQCYYAIKSLMIQSYQADKIVLWLADNQFPEHKLPKKFDELIARGLTVEYCEDMRAHKKYHYALQEQKENELVITYDDDIIYEYDSIEKLVKCHNKYSNCIICNRGFEIASDENGILPYECWKLVSHVGIDNPSFRIMPSTGYGCLYPYGIMPSKTFDFECAKQNAFSADDIWMRFCSLSKGINVVKTREKIATLVTVYGTQKESLSDINNAKRENSMTIERLIRVFPEVNERFRNKQ